MWLFQYFKAAHLAIAQQLAANVETRCRRSFRAQVDAVYGVVSYRGGLCTLVGYVGNGGDAVNK